MLSNDTEKIKNEQAKIQKGVRENRQRTDDLTEQVNQIGDSGKAAKFLSGTWRGTYRCGQGLTGMELIIYIVDSRTLRATFNFFPVASNPGVPRGSIAKKGTYDSSSFTLQGDYWIEQPAGYGMTEDSATFDSSGPEAIAGQIKGCHNFEIKKVSADSQPPPV
ncbi:hypothetical protein SAMN06264365_11454 [Actinoplanes regularis]|uniref:Uncharacterized protein n=2 Tax=Actinoplanes regularis TaxID=52697 RepID=A0A239DQM8_9ACTN|nr:hypothetical protein SAMN06264365_11454 [Actinoplanes regularis]